MRLLGKYHGFQCLVGVYPESMCPVTKSTGQTLNAHAVVPLQAEHRISAV